jgi:hypothetical protein
MERVQISTRREALLQGRRLTFWRHRQEKGPQQQVADSIDK